MVDNNIAMQTRPLDTATPIRQAQADENNNALAAEQTLKAHYSNLNEREQSRLRSTIVGAAQLKTYLDKGDVDGAHDFLVKRQAALHTRMGAGENVDTQETDYALDKLRTGDVAGLQNDVAGLMAAGQAYGMIGGQDGTPSSVREWQYYNSLPEAQKKEWLNNKRAGSNVDLGDKTIRLGADGRPEATYTKGVTPDNQPPNVAASAAAKVTGAAAGEAMASYEDAKAQLPRLEQVVTKLRDLGKTAAYTKGGVVVNEVARQLGAEVPQSGVDRTAYISTIDNEVLPMMRPIFGAAFTAKEGDSLKATLGDPDKSPPEKDAAITAFWEKVNGQLETLQRRTGQTQTPALNAGAGTTPGNQVKISNGKETYYVSPEDAQAAAAEGFKQVQ